jgi:hypothetical protein
MRASSQPKTTPANQDDAGPGVADPTQPPNQAQPAQPEVAAVMGTRPDSSECEYVELRARQDTAGTPFQVPADATDLYSCFLFSFGFEAPTQGLAFEAIHDNSNVVHHWVLRSLEPSDVTTRGPFLNCDNYYGTSKTIADWAPGSSDVYMPKDVGMELGSGLFYLEMHYNNIGRPATTDSSGLRICTTKKLRPQSASVSWLGNQLFSVPPKTNNYEVPGRCVPARHTQPIHILRTWPHMHRLGVHSSMKVQRATGMLETIFDEPFAFESQSAYDIPFTLNPGDSIQTSCFFSNPGNTAVSVGTKTTDEMCHFFVVAYPAGALTNNALSTETQVCL